MKSKNTSLTALPLSLSSLPLNLDDESTVEQFIKMFATTKGVSLANMLGLKGKGMKDRANQILAYACNKHTAIILRKEGEISGALVYEEVCDSIYARMDKRDRW